MGHIYKITNPNGKIYVGKTEREISKRIADHKWKGNNKNLILANSIKKYGWEAHIFEIIEEVEDQLLNDREKFWIAEFKTYCYENKMGMNMTKGGDGQRSTWIHDTERRKEQSERLLGDKNPFYGKVHSEETKKVIAEKAYKRQIERNATVPKWGTEKGHEKRKRSIVVYNIAGKKIAVFDSTVECCKMLNLSRPAVSTALSRNTHCNAKYFFRYNDDGNVLDQIEVPEKIKFNTKRPVVVMKDGVKKRYISAEDASKETGVPKTTINRAAYYNEGKPIRTGHIFYYE